MGGTDVAPDAEPRGRRVLVSRVAAAILGLGLVTGALVATEIVALPGSAFSPVQAGWVLESSHVGDRFTEGFPILRWEPGHERVRLNSVRFLGEVDGLRLVGARVTDDGAPAFDYVAEWPPENSPDPEVRNLLEDLRGVRPLTGAVLDRATGGRHHELILGIEVTEPGRWERTAIRVDYTENGIRRRQDLGFTAVVCTPEGLVDNACLNTFGEPVPVE